MALNISLPVLPKGRCLRFATIDRRRAISGTIGRRNALLEWLRCQAEREMQMEPKLNVTMRQVLNDLAFTAVAAIATGAAVGGIAFIVVRFFA